MPDTLFDLPGAAPARADSYETWMADLRPKLEPWLTQAAEHRREFTFYEAAKELALPEPPDPAHHWGRLATILQAEGLIRKHGWATSQRPTSHVSGVRTWRAVPQAELGAA